MPDAVGGISSISPSGKILVPWAARRMKGRGVMFLKVFSVYSQCSPECHLWVTLSHVNNSVCLGRFHCFLKQMFWSVWQVVTQRAPADKSVSVLSLMTVCIGSHGPIYMRFCEPRSWFTAQRLFSCPLFHITLQRDESGS